MKAFLQAIVAVLSGFIGIRKHKSAVEDVQRVRLPHVVAAGVCVLLGFAIIIFLVVQTVVR